MKPLTAKQIASNILAAVNDGTLTRETCIRSAAAMMTDNRVPVAFTGTPMTTFVAGYEQAMEELSKREGGRG